MAEREAFIRRFHAARPGVTTAAFARGTIADGRSTYARLADEVAAAAKDARVLDLGCGDGALLAMLAARGARAIGVDVSIDELRLARARDASVVHARAQALPFAAGAFDAAVSHLAFTLMDDVDAIAAELARVLAPGGRFAAIVGGGPTADATDAFARWLELLAGVDAHAHAPALGDRRARTAAGWRAILEPHSFTAIAFERIVVDLGGTFAEVFATLSTIYEAADVELAPLRAALAAEFAGAAAARVPCAMVVWLATATLTR